MEDVIFTPVDGALDDVILKQGNIVLTPYNITLVDTDFTCAFSNSTIFADPGTCNNPEIIRPHYEVFECGARPGNSIDNDLETTEIIYYIKDEIAVLGMLSATYPMNVTLVAPHGVLLNDFSSQNIDQLRIITAEVLSHDLCNGDIEYGPITDATVMLNSVSSNFLSVDSGHAKLAGNMTLNYLDLEISGVNEKGLAMDTTNLEVLHSVSFSMEVNSKNSTVALPPKLYTTFLDIFAPYSNVTLLEGEGGIFSEANIVAKSMDVARDVYGNRIAFTADAILSSKDAVHIIKALDSLTLNINSDFVNNFVLRSQEDLSINMGEGFSLTNESGMFGQNIAIDAHSFTNSGFVTAEGGRGITLKLKTRLTNEATGRINAGEVLYIGGTEEGSRVSIFVNYGKIFGGTGPHEIHAEEMKVITDFIIKNVITTPLERVYGTRSGICKKVEKVFVINSESEPQLILNGNTLLDTPYYAQKLGKVQIRGEADLSNNSSIEFFTEKLFDYYACTHSGSKHCKDMQSRDDILAFLRENEIPQIPKKLWPASISLPLKAGDLKIVGKKFNAEYLPTFYAESIDIDTKKFAYINEYARSEIPEIDFDNIKDVRLEEYLHNTEKKKYEVAVVGNNGELATRIVTSDDLRDGAFATDFFGEIEVNRKNSIFLFRRQESFSIGDEEQQARFYLNSIYGSDLFILLEEQILPYLHDQKTKCIEAIGKSAVNELFSRTITDKFGILVREDKEELGFWLLYNAAYVRDKLKLVVGEELNEEQLSELDRPIAWIVYDQRIDCYRFEIYTVENTQFVHGGLVASGSLTIRADDFYSGHEINGAKVNMTLKNAIVGGSVVSTEGTVLKATQLAMAGHLSVDEKGDILVNAKGDLLNVASSLYTNSGDVIFDIGGDIVSKVAHDSSGNIVAVPTFKINGNLTETSGGSIIEEGVTRFVGGSWTFEAAGTITQETYQQVKTVVDIITKKSRILRQTVLQAEDMAYVEGNINIKAEKYIGLGNILIGKQGITLIVDDGVEVRAITAYAHNHEYHKKKNWVGRSSLSISYTRGKTAQAQFYSDAEITIESTKCTFEGIRINEDHIDEEVKLGQKVRIKCSDGSEYIAHKVNNSYHVSSKKIGLAPKVPAHDILKDSNPLNAFVQSAGILSSLNQIANMKGPLDTAGFTRLLSDVAQINNAMKSSKDKDGNTVSGKSFEEAALISMLDGIARIGASLSNVKTETNIETGHDIPCSINGEVVEFETTGDSIMEATQLDGNTITVNVTGNLIFKSSTEQSKMRTKTSTKSLDVMIHLKGVTVSVSGSRSTSSSFTENNIASALRAGKSITVVVGKDFVIKGGEIKGNSTIKALRLIIEDTLNTSEAESQSVGGSVGMTFTPKGMIPHGSLSLGGTDTKEGKLFIKHAITGGIVEVDVETLIANEDQIKADELNISANNVINKARLQEQHKDVSWGVSGGVSLGTDGKMNYNIGGSYSDGDIVISGYWDSGVAEGLKAMQEMISSPDNPASAEDKKLANEVLEKAQEFKKAKAEQKREELDALDKEIMEHPEAQVHLANNPARRLALVATVDKLMEVNPEMSVSEATALAIDAIYDAESHIDGSAVTPAALSLVAVGLSEAVGACMSSGLCIATASVILKYTSDILADSLKGAQILSTPIPEPVDNTLKTPEHKSEGDVETFPADEGPQSQLPGFEAPKEDVGFTDKGFTVEEKDKVDILFKDMSNPVSDNPKTGSARKVDEYHSFNDIIDNYAGKASKFDIPTKDSNGKTVRTSELRQIEGSLNGVEGVFEWIVDQKQVTHRRFISGGKVTGRPNQIVNKKEK